MKQPKLPPGNILWVDLETTGLDPSVDEILELGVIITDQEVRPLALFEAVIVPAVPPRMTATVWEMHTKNGLLDEIASRDLYLSRSFGRMRAIDEANRLPQQSFWGRLEQVASQFTLFVGAHGFCRGRDLPTLGGSSVSWFDRPFLERFFTIPTWNHRNIDTAQLREMARRWLPDVVDTMPPKSKLHRALPDAHAALMQTAWFLENLMPKGLSS